MKNKVAILGINEVAVQRLYNLFPNFKISIEYSNTGTIVKCYEQSALLGTGIKLEFNLRTKILRFSGAINLKKMRELLDVLESMQDIDMPSEDGKKEKH